MKDILSYLVLLIIVALGGTIILPIALAIGCGILAFVGPFVIPTFCIWFVIKFFVANKIGLVIF